MAPLFKKLTDCPENLREAIDWLIQVRHGSNNGLEELAKALKKLIEEAIANAYTTNVNALLKLLDSAKSYNCCKDKVTGIEKYKEPKANAKYSFDEIKNHCESIRDCTKNHLDDPQQKSYDEIKSKLAQLENLSESLNGFTNVDSCKNLLTNLCSGLEAFLGFDPKSKGYDGTGIVYSDVDRLCDGVMGFMLSCLEGSKELLKHYNPDIENKIAELKALIGKGSGAGKFGEAMGKVKAGLQGYEKELSKTCNGLKSWYEDMLKTEIKPLQSEIHGFRNVPLETQLTMVTEAAKQCTMRAKAAEMAAQKLDGTLSKKLESSITLVKQSAETLRKVNEDGLLKRQARAVNTEMQTQQGVLNKAVNDRFETLRKVLNGEYNQIKSGLTNLKEGTLNAEMDLVKKALLDAQHEATSLLSSLDNDYKKKIEAHFSQLRSKMTDIDRYESEENKGKKSKLKEQADVIHDIIEGLGTTLNKTANAMGGVINKAVQNVNTALSTLDSKVQQDLQKLKTDIESTITSVINTVKSNGIKRIVDGDFKNKYGVDVFDAFEQGLNDVANPRLESLINWARQAGQKGEITEALNGIMDVAGRNHFSKLKTFLDELGKNITDRIKEEGKQNFFDAVSADIKEKVVGDFNGAHQHVNSVRTRMGNYKAWVANDPKNSESLHGKIDAIRTDLKDFFTKGNISVSSAFNFDSEHFSEYKRKKTQATRAIEEVLKKITALESLPGAVEDAKVAAGNLVEQLMERMDAILDQIDDIDDVVQKAKRILQKAIDALSNAVEQSRRNIISECEKLRYTLLNQIKTSFEILTSQVRSLFAKQKQAELSALESVVTEQLEAINRVIEEDRGSGLKGFLSRLKGDLDPDDHPADPPGKMLEALKTAVPITPKVPQKREEALKKFAPLAGSFTEYVDIILNYIESQVKTPNKDPTLPAEQNSQSKQVHKIKGKLDKLLKYLMDNTKKTYNFDRTFSDYLRELVDAVAALSADKFGDGVNPELLNVVKTGVIAFDTQLMYAYINRYCGQTITWAESKDGKVVPTDKATNCAKAFITLFNILFDHLDELLENVNENGWDTERVYYLPTEHNPLGEFFDKTGFGVPTRSDITDNELKNKNDFTGEHVAALFYDLFKGGKSSILYTISDRCEEYYRVRHLSHFSSNKYPCSVFDMLKWICGLTFNSVYNDLSLNGFDSLFDKPEVEAAETQELTIRVVDEKPASLSAYPQDINTPNLIGALTEVCHHAHNILTAFLGHGHESGIYACEFNTNFDGFMYPAGMDSLICMLREILYRLYQQFQFLYDQCQHSTKLSGWSDCLYGRYVGGSDWRCNDNQCPNQSCGQTCGQHPKCGLKSPLQSFLEDGLQGFLPHHLKYERGRLECSVKKHSNLPCITPMGFNEIGNIASHIQTGLYLKDFIEVFCGSADSPLSKLCGQLQCLLPSAPKTLGDMFGFYYNIFVKWDENTKRNSKHTKHREDAFRNALKKANFMRRYDLNAVTRLFKSDKHSPTHVSGDMCSIRNPHVSCYTANKYCGAYVDSLSNLVYGTFASKHADKYLCWIVYLTESFCDLLRQLYETCHGNCGSGKRGCQITGCADSVCHVSKSTNVEGIKHSGICNSIIQCRSTYSVLYSSGLTFANRQDMNGRIGTNDVPKRSCKNFCEALKIILGHNSVLLQLRYEIDNFLLEIRFPFMTLTLALWLLSLLYLLHIMVIRLDLLHIKSHLHSPSSHRIAAQSLLAAARVNKLNRVFYLQP